MPVSSHSIIPDILSTHKEWCGFFYCDILCICCSFHYLLRNVVIAGVDWSAMESGEHCQWALGFRSAGAASAGRCFNYC